MARGRSLLKWGAILLIAGLIPQLIPILGLYFAWRRGFVAWAKRLAAPLCSRLRIWRRASRWRFTDRGDLHEIVTSQRFYMHEKGAPLAFIPDPPGFRCVSALRLEGGGSSPQLYKKAAGEAFRLLAHNSRVILVLPSDGQEWDRVYIVSKDRVAKGDFMRSGTEMVERLRVAADLIESASPSMKVKLCRGEEITAPLLEGLR